MKSAAESISGKWGVFNHYLFGNVCNPKSEKNLGTGITDWNKAIEEFDVEKLAFRLHKMNAGYYFITIMQGDKHMIAPNATFDKIAGTKPGDACPLRDLPLELANELSKYNIDLCLYYTGDGPHHDEIVGGNMGFTGDAWDGRNLHVDENFCKNWASVLEEYAVRYGDKVKAWWIDGCYQDLYGYNDELCKIYYDAVKRGNPNGAVAFNKGVKNPPVKGSSFDDYTCGEFNDFLYMPTEKYINGALNHVLAPLGYNGDTMDEWSGWSYKGIKHPKEYLRDYIRAFTKVGGAVSVDVWVNIDGSFDPEQEALLNWVGNNL